jgi:hypothetical protein
MLHPESVRAGPRGDAVTCSQDAAHGGAWHLLRANHEAAQDDVVAWSLADSQLANGGLCKCAVALLEASPVVSDVSWYSLLWALDVRSAADLHFDAVVPLPSGRFDFARDVRDATSAVVALIVPAHDDTGELDDLVALDLERDFLGTWLGQASMLGQHNLYGWRVGEPLVAHETALDWLRADRQGVFVINPQRPPQGAGRHRARLLARESPSERLGRHCRSQSAWAQRRATRGQGAHHFLVKDVD